MTVEVKIGKTLVAIDKGIVEVVKRLNELGFRTLYSCSGLREDHCGLRRIEGITSVTVAGARFELIEIAELCGWDWSLHGEVSHGKDSGHYVNFFSRQGRVYRVANDTKCVWWAMPTPSTVEESIESTLPFEYTSISTEPDVEESRKDRSIKRQISYLLVAIEYYECSRGTGKDCVAEELTDR